MTEVTMIVNDGAFQPFYGVPMEMAAHDVALRGLNPFWVGETYLPASVAAYTETHMPYTGGMLALYNPKCLAAVEESYFFGLDGGRAYLVNTGSTAHIGVLRVEGIGYQCVVSIPFDIPDIEDSYFKSGEVDKVEVILNHAAQAADTKIVLDELVKY